MRFSQLHWRVAVLALGGLTLLWFSVAGIPSSPLKNALFLFLIRRAILNGNEAAQ